MKALLLLAFSISIINVHAQISSDSELFINLQKQDSLFFERSFNQCDMEYLNNHIARDLKFYHDQSGFQNRDDFFHSIRKNICGETDKKPIRKPEVESFEVYPLYNNGILYAAIQKGEHKFYNRENGKEDLWTGIAKFTHVWTIKDDRWILSEVLSYDHKAAANDH